MERAPVTKGQAPEDTTEPKPELARINQDLSDSLSGVQIVPERALDKECPMLALHSSSVQSVPAFLRFQSFANHLHDFC